MDIERLDVGEGAMAFSTMRGDVSHGHRGHVASSDNGVDGIYGGGNYEGFSVCHYTGDTPEHIAQCRRELADYVGVEMRHLIIPRQTHSINVAVIGNEMPCLESVDAMVSRRRDVALVVNTADCLPIVFNDSDKGIVGIAHGGWRGLYGGIVEATVAAMERLGAVRGSLRVAIGPSICGDCYEVDEEFAERFEKRFGAAVVRRRCGEKPHVDLREAAMVALSEAGVGRDRVVVSRLCSRCDDRLFSARRQGVKSGRIATVVKLM